MQEIRRTWKEVHGDAPYIPCGNAYCAEGNCSACEIQMELQVEHKTELGIPFEELTKAEQAFYKFIHLEVRSKS